MPTEGKDTCKVSQVSAFLLVSTTIFAQEINTDLKMAVEQVQNSFNACDNETMDPLMGADFEVVSVFGTFFKPEQGALCGNGQSYDYNFEVVRATVVGETGIAVYRATGSETNGEGETMSVNSVVTSVWFKDGEQWKLKHVHIAVPLEQ